jgi:hypothetical protein
VATGFLLAAVVIATGCGSSGGSNSGGVAQLGSAKAPAAGEGAAAAPTTSTASLNRLEEFSQCMRSHGVPNFLDPTVGAGGTVGLQVKGGPAAGKAGIDPNSPAFQSASTACRKFAPPRPTAAQAAQAQASVLKFSACMRAHGVPGFPDPTFGSGGQIRMQLTPSSGVDPNSPAFARAQSACQQLRGGGAIQIPDTP